jgi:hypothetical protein
MYILQKVRYAVLKGYLSIHNSGKEQWGQKRRLEWGCAGRPVPPISSVGVQYWIGYNLEGQATFFWPSRSLDHFTSDNKLTMHQLGTFAVGNNSVLEWYLTVLWCINKFKLRYLETSQHLNTGILKLLRRCPRRSTWSLKFTAVRPSLLKLRNQKIHRSYCYK